MINYLSSSHIVATLRISQALLGFLTTLLIIKNVTIEEQGLYYAFVNFASSYVFFDLGLSNLLVQIFSRLNDKKNDFENNIYLVRKHFLKLSFLFCIFLTPIGVFYFSNSIHGLPSQSWIEAWVCLVIATALSMTVNPIFSIVESMGKIKESYSVKILALLVGAFFSWSLIYSHHFLYAPLAVPLALSVIGYVWAFKKYSFIFAFKINHQNAYKVLLKKKFHASYIRTIPTYIASCLFLFTPPLISFYFNGSAVSGQLSLSLVFVNMVGIVASSSIVSKTPLLTHLISNNEVAKGKNIYLTQLIKAISLNIFGYILLMIILYVFKDSYLAHRFLKIYELCLLCLMSFINQLVFLIHIFYRAKNQEPLAKSYFFSTIGGLSIALFFGYRFGNMGIIMSMTLAYIIFCLPLIFKYWRKII